MPYVWINETFHQVTTWQMVLRNFKQVYKGHVTSTALFLLNNLELFLIKYLISNKDMAARGPQQSYV